jgi:IS1 family transposase
MEAQSIPGYTFGTPEVARSPVTGADVELLKATLLWSDDDDRYLRMAGEVLADQVEDVLELWYGYVGSHPHLVRYFADRDGQPIGAYLERVRARFAQWVRDVCSRPHDDAWRDYQHEIALRHTRAKKNQTDAVESVPDVALRYRLLLELIAGLQRHGAISVARMCVTCRFFRRDAHPNPARPHHCALVDAPLSSGELRVDCAEHEPRAA